MKRRMSKGFTLIELLVVIAILAILAMIALTQLSGSTKSAQVATHNANLRTIESAAVIYVSEHPDDSTLASGVAETTWVGTDGYLKEWPKIPGAVAEVTSAQKYDVVISKGGAVTVSPEKVEIDSNGDIKPVTP